MLDRCRSEQRRATPDEQAVLARWSGWGALPDVFDEDQPRRRHERDRIRRLLGSEEAWAQARLTTLNAHYTSAPVAQAMWGLATRLGFESGRVLEPGCGAGTFLGFAPPGADLVGVELDPTTAEVAHQLYGGRATVHAMPFEDFDGSDGAFDLTIGNVPFARLTPHDPRRNRHRHSLHNYFLVKSLRLTRPGGLVLALTSRFTLDAANPAARREMASLADLVGAVRFPGGAFREAAGTDVVEDLLVFRRRLPGDERAPASWTTAVPASTIGLDPDGDAQPGGDEPLIGRYFADHPDLVLGRLGVGRSQYGDGELLVQPDGDLAARLADALDRIVADARARGLTHAPARIAPDPPTAPPPAPGDWDLRFAQEGSFVTGRSGAVGRLRDGAVHPYRPRVAKDAGELRRLVHLRDATRELLALQLADASDDDVRVAQQRLADHYDAYVRLYGPLNRYTVSAPAAGDGRPPSTPRRLRPRMGGFRTHDPDWPLVAALEDFDDTTQVARPAAIFTERVIAPPVDRLGVDTPQEAVAACLDESGTVTATRVAELLDVGEEEARRRLDGLVFADPDSGALVPTHQYLSGNVRRKRDVARRAAEVDGRWAANVAALEGVMPRQLEPGGVTVRLGAPWVAPEDVEAFCDQVLGARIEVEYLAEVGRWEVKRRSVRSHVAVTSEWGTSDADAVTLLGAALDQRMVTITQMVNGVRVRKVPETLAAREKQEAIGERFSAWVWEDTDRGRRIADDYNQRFTSTVLPTYDGSHLTFPGLATDFTPRTHQRDAVARILTDGRALLAHAVGAGKTATMVMAAMELRRLGSVHKPAVVVPNHMLEQFSREWLQLYPNARLLIASKDDLSAARRKEFVARCAADDWDGVVFTMSSFARLGVGRDVMAGYLREQVDAARSALATSRSGKRLSVKKLELRVKQLEEKHKELLAAEAKDDGVRWEQTGIDYLFVDEAHAYKNRRIDTAIDGVTRKASKRPEDLAVKLWALRRAHGPRTLTMATATPVANAIAELWVMQAYLQPDVLAEAGVGRFDAWAATFARTHTALELAPDGGSYRMQTRLARYQNVPELLSMYRRVADVRTSDELGLPIPAIAGGKPETVVVPASDTLSAYVESLVRRAEKCRNRMPRRGEDNMLAVVGDGRRAALDLRLVDLPPDPDGGKVRAAARRIAAIHEANRDRGYRDAGGPAARPGALQLVFCDASTPAAEGWNPYDELRDQLVARGVPRHAVRFMQDASDDAAKARLFAACRDGSVAVLIGSTETMGVGTNVQARAIAMHHLDAPWRPADIEQRDGRILRQGNQNPTVEVIRYVTEGSFDTYMWQTLERKAAFIAQVTRGDVGDRDVAEIDDQTLSFAEIKALASGDPRILEKAGVDNEIARLTRLEDAWRKDQQNLRRTVRECELATAVAQAQAEGLAAVLGRVSDTTGDRFRMTVDGHLHTTRVDAGQHLQRLVAARLAAAQEDAASASEPVAVVGGLVVEAQVVAGGDGVRLHVRDADATVAYDASSWQDADPSRLVQGIERQLRLLPGRLDRARQEVASANQEAREASARLGQRWEHTDRLAHLRRRQRELADLLRPDDPPASPPAGLAEGATVAADGAERAGGPGAAAAPRAPTPGPRSGPPDVAGGPGYALA